MLETVRGAVRRLSKSLFAPLNAIIIIIIIIIIVIIIIIIRVIKLSYTYSPHFLELTKVLLQRQQRRR